MSGSSVSSYLSRGGFPRALPMPMWRGRLVFSDTLSSVWDLGKGWEPPSKCSTSLCFSLRSCFFSCWCFQLKFRENFRNQETVSKFASSLRPWAKCWDCSPTYACITGITSILCSVTKRTAVPSSVSRRSEKANVVWIQSLHKSPRPHDLSGLYVYVCEEMQQLTHSLCNMRPDSLLRQHWMSNVLVLSSSTVCHNSARTCWHWHC